MRPRVPVQRRPTNSRYVSVKAAVKASDLRPTPAQLLAALARVGR